MNKTKSILLTASMVLALTLTFSCSGDGGGDDAGGGVANGGGGNSSDSSGGGGGKVEDSSSSFGVDGDVSSSSSDEINSSSSSSSSSSIGNVISSSSSAEVSTYCVIDIPKECVIGVTGEKCEYRGYSGYVQTECPGGYLIVSSSSSVSSSSIGNVVSSSSSDIIYGSLTYEGQTYKTVKIGTQTWMAENLNYNATGSKCYKDNSYYCTEYGRLYSWAAAMSACPEGWHLPSDDEWSILVNYAGGSDIAGKKLKAASGWNDFNGISGDGTNDYGFLALPGGLDISDVNYPNGSFTDVGGAGFWWSASENGSNYAYVYCMAFSEDNANRYNNFYKSRLLSVRCLQGPSQVPSSSSVNVISSSSSVVVSSSSSSSSSIGNVISSSSSIGVSSSSSSSSSNLCADFVNGTTRLHYGQDKPQFCDERDGNKYVYVTIGSQTWMAENLNYNAEGSKCHNNLVGRCYSYGRLYNWATAMALPASCNGMNCSSSIQSPHKGICPTNWHLPSEAEWTVLTNYVEQDSGCSSCAGKHLKASSGWICHLDYMFYPCSDTEELDTYGFSALPGSNGTSNGGFSSVSNGYWWSATGPTNAAYHLYMHFDSNREVGEYAGKSDLFSVRCVRD